MVFSNYEQDLPGLSVSQGMQYLEALKAKATAMGPSAALDYADGQLKILGYSVKDGSFALNPAGFLPIAKEVASLYQAILDGKAKATSLFTASSASAAVVPAPAPAAASGVPWFLLLGGLGAVYLLTRRSE